MWGALLLSACSTPTPEPAPPPAPATAAPTDPTTEAPRPAEPRAPRDRPPTIDAITLSPTAPNAADTLVADVKASDPEEARIDLDFTWYVNDVPVVGIASERLGGRFAKGDKVRVRVVADDGTTEVESDSEVVTIGNRPPVFETGPKDVNKVDGFTFRATDPDGDALTWRLENAPPGMSISPTGVLAYHGSEDDPGGRYVVAVVVEDGEAWGRFEFPLNVSPGSNAKAPPVGQER